MTKIDIISGFLGAGKTTFIKKLLKEAIAGEKVVLIENEFGEIGIDGAAPIAPIMPGYGARTMVFPVYCSNARRTASFRKVPPWTGPLAPKDFIVT